MDVMPKITDIKNLKDLSKIIVLPMLCACYISHGDFALHFGDYVLSINDSDADALKILKAAGIFAGGTLYSALLFSLIYMGLIFVDIEVKGMLMPPCILLLLTFGFSGIFANESVTQIIHLETMWFYASFVTAFFLLSMVEQLRE